MGFEGGSPALSLRLRGVESVWWEAVEAVEAGEAVRALVPDRRSLQPPPLLPPLPPLPLHLSVLPSFRHVLTDANPREVHLRYHTALSVVTAMLLGTAPAAAQYDVLIRGGRVLDGLGNPAAVTTIAIQGDRIVALGELSEATAALVVDASGLYVSPGFIDVHSHAGGGLASEELSHARPLLAQGITTVIINPDGGGPVDLERQRHSLLEHGLGLNVALLVPHGSV